MEDCRYKSIIENLPIGYAYQRIILNEDHIPIDYEFLEVNAAFEKLMGLKETDIVGNQAASIDLGINHGDQVKLYGYIAMYGSQAEFEYFAQPFNRWYRVNVHSPKKYYFVTYFTDISKEKYQQAECRRIKDALKVSEEKYRLLTEYTSDVIWVLNLKSRKFTYVSPSVLQLRGITAEEAIDETLEEALTPESLTIIREAITKKAAEFLANPDDPKFYIFEIQQPCKNGQLKWVEISIKYRRGLTGDIEIVGVSRDIEERKKTERKVLQLSYHDQLTGLYNRRFYEEELKRLDTERNLPLTLVIADMNGLKLTNDAFGHLVGDKLLITVGELIKNNCRSDDIVARMGGDEFILLLPKTSSARAEEIVHRIKRAIALEKEHPVAVSVSFGWATKQDMAKDIAEVYKEAEAYMYRHKLSQSSSMKSETIKIITHSLYQKSEGEQKHSERVGTLCAAMARALKMSTNDINEMETAGLLHDIGKIGIDERLLDKPGELADNQLIEMKRHPEIGYQILKSSPEFTNIAEYILCHHERVDGKGYPRGMQGDAIPIQARILSVAEAYASMTSDKGYRTALSEAEAIEEIKRNAGTQFDSDMAKVFIEKVLGKEWV